MNDGSMTFRDKTCRKEMENVTNNYFNILWSVGKRLYFKSLWKVRSFKLRIGWKISFNRSREIRRISFRSLLLTELSSKWSLLHLCCAELLISNLNYRKNHQITPETNSRKNSSSSSGLLLTLKNRKILQ